jgi:hypothetical protein
MFLRCTKRKKDSRQHSYYSVVENRRVGHHQVTQRTVLYLGELIELQKVAWQELLEDLEREAEWAICLGHSGLRCRI